jgi:hypothetical protein
MYFQRLDHIVTVNRKISHRQGGFAGLRTMNPAIRSSSFAR